MIDIELLNAAIANGEYDIYFAEPNNVDICTRYDGTKFCILRGDDAKFGVSGGSCSVDIAGYYFTCDLSNGDWEESNEGYISDSEVTDILESIPGVLCGEMLDPDSQREVYYKANPDAEYMDFYWYEDEGIPKDIDNLGFDEVELNVFYKTDSTDELTGTNIFIDDLELYKLYLVLKNTENLDGLVPADKEYVLDSNKIRLYAEDVYESIKLCLAEKTNKNMISFNVPVSSDLFDRNL